MLHLVPMLLLLLAQQEKQLLSAVLMQLPPPLQLIFQGLMLLRLLVLQVRVLPPERWRQLLLLLLPLLVRILHWPTWWLQPALPALQMGLHQLSARI